MKMRFFNLASVLLLAALSTFAQSSNNEDEVIKIAQYAGREYCEGEMIVKFKSSSAVRVQSVTRGVRAGVNKVDEVFGELGVTAGEQLMPLTGSIVSQAKARRSLSGKIVEDVDLSQLYCLRFDESKTDMPNAIEKISALDEVEYAEPNYIVRTQTVGEGSEVYDTAEEVAAYQAEPLYSQQWGLPAINMPQLWAQPKITTKRPVIAIIDTGVDTTHPDLVDNLWVNTAEAEGEDYADDDANGFADDVHGWDFIKNRPLKDDPNGHGTHCAGIAAAVGNNGIGITGANPDALIMPIKVLGTDGIGGSAALIKGIDYAVSNGADVISMSLGTNMRLLSLKEACEKASNSAYLVAAAGNEGKNIYDWKYMPSGLYFPAAFDAVVGVMASDHTGNRVSFSNYDSDGPYWVDYDVFYDDFFNYEILAPGVKILSTYPGGKYKSLNGTSMATPLVSGALSRLLQTKSTRYKGNLIGDMVNSADEQFGVFDIAKSYQFTDENRGTQLIIQGALFEDITLGDGDGFIEAGEVVEIFPIVRCLWGSASNIKLRISIDSEFEKETAFEIIENNVEFGFNLSSMSWGKSQNPLKIKINENIITGWNLRLLVSVNADEMQEPRTKEFEKTVYNNANLGGVISDSLILYPDKEYLVSRNLLVEQGAMMTIMPGTKIKFTENVTFQNQGTVVCVGSPDSLIVFEPVNQKSYSYTLNGLTMDYCHIKQVKMLDGCNLTNCILDAPLLFNACYYTLNMCNLYDFWTNVMDPIFTDYWRYKIDCCNMIMRSEGIRYPEIPLYKPEALQSTINSNILVAPEVCIIRGGEIVGKVHYEIPNYYGTTREDIIRERIYDINHPTHPTGVYSIDLSNRLTRPNDKAHGIVWKVVVDGYDAQDEFEQLPPLGVGRHKFEVYFNRPMNTEVTPTVAMGAEEPYNQISIDEDGAWNEDGTIYTVYLTLDGKTESIGMNRIYVADAVESFDYYYIRKELESLLSKSNSILSDADALQDNSLISGDEISKIQQHIAYAKTLCAEENEDANLLQATLDQTYTYYNQLAEILEHPTITQVPVNIPPAPEWAIPVENIRYNVNIQVAGSLSTGLMAQAGLGKVTLTWETDEEDFEDLLGYNIYRYTETPDSVSVKDYEKYNDYNYHWEYFTRRDTIRVNQTTIESHEQQLVDYDVEPGITYYYYITQMTTSLNSYNLSNVVTATPLTAKKGDANGSMNVDIADVVTEVAYITYQDPQPFIFEAADVNSDAKVNVLDVVGTIGIITTPAEIGVSSIDDAPVRYYVKDGVLYVENTQPLGGVQVRLGVAKGTAITALEALTGMEQTSVWTSDSEYLFLAYSMSGRTLAPGTHALLQIGNEANVTEVIISDAKGRNLTAVDGNATGIGKVEAVQLQMPSPNPFTTVLRVPYTIGKSGSHEVTISFSDLAGRTIDAYHTVNTPGEYTYTWYPRALEKGLYLVNLYVDGELMQTVKVIKN